MAVKSDLFVVVLTVPNFKTIFFCSAMKVNLTTRSTAKRKYSYFLLLGLITDFAVLSVRAKCGHVFGLKTIGISGWRPVYWGNSKLFKACKSPYQFFSKIQECVIFRSFETVWVFSTVLLEEYEAVYYSNVNTM